ncbi:hypothetical protein QT781_20535, partial [Xanthomonas citri pv. citri]
MATSGAQRPHGPRSLAEVLDAAWEQAPPPAQSAPRPTAPAPGKPASHDGFLYSGNRHESVPRALFLDRRLTPLERNA